MSAVQTIDYFCWSNRIQFNDLLLLLRLNFQTKRTTNEMVKLIIEFGRQRRKFDLIDPIDIDSVENEIKLSFDIDRKHLEDYLIQIYDEEINDFLDLTSDCFQSIQSNFIKGQIVCKQIHSPSFANEVLKEDIVGLVTLESLFHSLQNWSHNLQSFFVCFFICSKSHLSLCLDIQNELAKQIDLVQQTIVAVKSHVNLRKFQQSN